MFTNHVNVSQAFVQGELLPGDGHNGKVHISSPPGYDEHPLYVSSPEADLWHALCSQSLTHHHERFPGKRRMCHGGI